MTTLLICIKYSLLHLPSQPKMQESKNILSLTEILERRECRGSRVGAAKCKGVAVVVGTLRLTTSESRCCRASRSPLCAAWHAAIMSGSASDGESGVHHMGWERCLLATWMDENGVQRKRHEQVLELQLVGTEYFVGAAGEHGVLGRACLLRCRRRRRKDHHQDFFWCNMV